jgi:hypothetical protein
MVHVMFCAVEFILPAPSFATRSAGLFKPASTSNVFRTDLLVITPGRLPDGDPCPPDAAMEYLLTEYCLPDGTAAVPQPGWQRARQDLWPGHSEWCFALPPGSMKVQVRCVKDGVESDPSPAYDFFVRGGWVGLALACLR